jgi:hypothetical protein
MDKILAKLKAANISEADLEEIKTAFDGARILSIYYPPI